MTKKLFGSATLRSKKKAFTLIELLVVIAIIGILSTLSVVSFGSVQAKSRDSQRKADLSKISGALELYKSDKKTYPKTVAMTAFPDCVPIPSSPVDWLPVDDQCFSGKLTSGNYISSVPVNPEGAPPYLIMSNGTSYKIIVTSETISTQEAAGEFFNPANPKCLQDSPDTIGLNFPDDSSYCTW